MSTPHIISAENAAQISDWLATRGGIAIWTSIDLSDPGFSLTTPLHNADGSPVTKPHWKVDGIPERVITDASEILVSTYEEVKRFHVAIRLGSQGMSYKVSDSGSRRIRREVAKAGEGAFHQFDYMTQEAVIFAAAKMVPLKETISYLIRGENKNVN